jgi:hypothetical protein
VRGADGALAICELCFQGASEDEIAACAVDLDIDALEVEGEETLVAFALAPGIGRACEATLTSAASMVQEPKAHR